MTPGTASEATLRGLRDQGALEAIPVSARGAVRITGHASNRRFFRLLLGAGSGSAILAVYPPDQGEALERQIRCTRWLQAAGVRVPRVLVQGPRSVLLEDGGDDLLSNFGGHSGSRLRYYRQALEAMVQMQRHAEHAPLPNPEWALDAERLRAELAFAERHAIAGWLGVGSGSTARGRAFDRLVEAIARLPMAVCHRDFHARNLLVFNERIVVLDFQDLMAGPFLYDLASLLWDNYCDPGYPLVSEVLSRFWHRRAWSLTVDAAAAIPTLPPGLPPAARQAFCLVGLQRSIKALGTFGYQVSVAGNAGYARYVPRTWRHVQTAANALGWEDLLAAMPDFDQACISQRGA